MRRRTHSHHAVGRLGVVEKEERTRRLRKDGGEEVDSGTTALGQGDPGEGQSQGGPGARRWRQSHGDSGSQSQGQGGSGTALNQMTA